MSTYPSNWWNRVDSDSPSWAHVCSSAAWAFDEPISYFWSKFCYAIIELWVVMHFVIGCILMQPCYFSPSITFICWTGNVIPRKWMHSPWHQASGHLGTSCDVPVVIWMSFCRIGKSNETQCTNQATKQIPKWFITLSGCRPRLIILWERNIQVNYCHDRYFWFVQCVVEFRGLSCMYVDRQPLRSCMHVRIK